MQTISHDPNDDLRPCSECPHYFVRKWRQPLCGKAAYRDTVSGEPYQTCREVRGLNGGLHISGHRQQCLGYDHNKHATVSRKKER